MTDMATRMPSGTRNSPATITAVGATNSSPVSGRRAAEPRDRRVGAPLAGASAPARVVVNDTTSSSSVRRVQARLDLGLPAGERLVDVGAVECRPDRGQPRPVRVVEQVAEGQGERRVAVLQAVRD